jgi:hypothetical protein
VPLSNAEEREISQITFIVDPGESDMFTVLVDGCAAGSTTDDRSKLHGYKAITVHKAFHDAGKRSHASAGEGYMRLACGTSAEASNKYVIIHCFHTPTLPVTVLSPGRFVARHESKYEAQTIYTNHRNKHGYARIHGLADISDIYIPCIVHGVLLYSRASSPSSTKSLSASPVTLDAHAHDVDSINHLNAEATRILWHQRIGHMHFQKLSDLHKHVDGIPQIALPTDIDGCPSCWVCKIQRTNRGSADTRQDATVVGQGISMDWGFIVQRSKTKAVMTNSVVGMARQLTSSSLTTSPITSGVSPLTENLHPSLGLTSGLPNMHPHQLSLATAPWIRVASSLTIPRYWLCWHIIGTLRAQRVVMRHGKTLLVNACT